MRSVSGHCYPNKVSTYLDGDGHPMNRHEAHDPDHHPILQLPMIAWRILREDEETLASQSLYGDREKELSLMLDAKPIINIGYPYYYIKKEYLIWYLC